jgi:hypothetical protein
MVKLRIAMLAALAVGCSVVNDPGAHRPEGPIEASAFCRTLAEMQCDAYVRCCSAAGPGDIGVCVEEAQAACAMNEGIGRLLLDARTGYDPVYAAEVLAVGRRLAQACDTGLLPWMVERSGIQSIFTGTIAPGSECTPRSVNPFDFDYPAVFSCEGTDYTCAATGGPEWVCATRREVGGGCITYFDCVDGLRCDAFRCAERLPNGSACTNAVDCASGGCVEGRCVDLTQDALYCGIATVL